MISKKALDWMLSNSILLITGTLIALVWANISPHSYHGLIHGEWFGLASFHFLATDIGMAFFFGIAAKEIREAMLPGGSLASVRKAATPLVATLGGVVGPALLYAGGAMALDKAYLRGWAIPCATDIAFAMLAARFVFGKKSPVVAFLLLLAIADDAIGLGIIAGFYPTKLLSPMWLSGLALALMINFLMMERGVKSFWWYILVGGTLSWISLYKAGLHPSLALVPIMWTMPHAKRDEGVFMEDHSKDALNAFEHRFKIPVEVILLSFGLANAGVELSSIGTGTVLVGYGLLFGKPIGIVLFTLLGIEFFKLSLPEGMNNRDLVVAGMMAGIGFTVALFVSSVAFPPGAEQDSAKMGALISFGAAGLSVLAAKILGVGRYARKEVLPSTTIQVI